MALPVGVMVPPLLSTAPPLSVSPTKPDGAGTQVVSDSRTGHVGSGKCAGERYLEAVVVGAPPPPKLATVTVAPAGRIGISAAWMPAAE